MNKKKLIVVLGMHRSGTSMLTGILNILGAHVGSGEDLVPAVSGDNDKGFFELKSITSINETILNILGSSHLESNLLPENFAGFYELYPYKNQLKAIIKEYVETNYLFVLKDPRISRLLPIYKEIFSELSIDVKYIISVRNPLEVAKSLEKRNGLKLENGIAAWKIYNLDAEYYTKNEPRVFVSYDALLADWKKEITRISAEINLNLELTTKEIAVNNFISNDLHRNTANLEELKAFPEIKEIYEILSKEKPDTKNLEKFKTHKAQNKKTVCIATQDIVGPVRNGGIGTALYNQAIFLKEQGFAVTILYLLGGYSENGPVQNSVKIYEEIDINFVPLSGEYLPTQNLSENRKKSFQAYLWLKHRNFNFIHFHEWQGIPFYSVLAKNQGEAFQNTKIIVGLHSPTIWHKKGNAEFLNDVNDMEANFMEKESCRLADIVVSPSEYMLSWCKENHWEFSENKVIHNLYFKKNDTAKEIKKIKEIVYFGRLEYRKGLKLFIDSITKFSKEELKDLTFTFLGKDGIIEGKFGSNYIKDRLAPTHVNYKIINNKNSSDAVEYLKEPGKLAVICSKSENSPYVVLECLMNEIDFIAAKTGGIPELIDKNSHDVLFELKPDSLRKKIFEKINAPAKKIKTNFNEEKTKKQWLEIYTETKNKVPSATNRPLVSILITHFERPNLLKETLRGIENQTYKNFEVIIVDDGSTNKESIDFLKSLQKEYKVIYQENSYLGAARNKAASHAKGEYLIFMDDDNFAMPFAIEKFVSAVINSGSDIATASNFVFNGTAPAISSKEIEANTFLGGSLETGLFENLFGDANAIIKKSVFDEIGGFTEEYGIGHEDYELFVKSALKKYKVITIPEPLYYYRVNSSSMINTVNIAESAYRSLSPYEEKFPEIAASLALAKSYYNNLRIMRFEVSKLHTEIRNFQQAYQRALADLARVTASEQTLQKTLKNAEPILEEYSEVKESWFDIYKIFVKINKNKFGSLAVSLVNLPVKLTSKFIGKLKTKIKL